MSSPIITRKTSIMPTSQTDSFHKTTNSFYEAVNIIRQGADLDAATEQLLGQLTQDEKLWLLDGDSDFWVGIAEMSAGYNLKPIVMGEIKRLGIPGLRFSDGPRGVVMGASTAFPVSMARGATWDVEMEERIGVAIGRELRVQGGNFFGGVCINLPRHPAWGRAQETYGEDPILLGEFGAALVRGVQRNAMAVAKHYALNSMENARFKVDVLADEQTLHEAFLPHFRRVVEEGVDGIMTSYNSVNGEWAGQNETLLEGTLRSEWGFEGVTITDFVSGFRDAGLSLRAGLDVEAPMRQQRAQQLPEDLESGRVTWEHVDRAAKRVLRTQLRHYASAREEEPAKEVIFCSEHRNLAREAAATSMVLLKNDAVDGTPVLPLGPEKTNSVALIGRLANLPNTGDHGSSSVRSPEVVTALEGLRNNVPEAQLFTSFEDDPKAAAATAKKAEVAIVVVGYTAEDEGEYIGGDSMLEPDILALFPPFPEGMDPSNLMGAAGAMGSTVGGDRASLRLRPVDEEIIRATAAANPKTVVVVVTAGAVITESWRDSVPAMLVGWYSGSEGGNALTDVLYGKADASGRLPYSIPTTEEHLPYFDRDATSITYDRWFGQRLLDRDGHNPAFPLGYGLSYTTFDISDLTVTQIAADSVTVTTRVTNTGERAGRHVVQLYGSIEAEDFPRRVLLGFKPVNLAPGETKTMEVAGSLRPLQRRTNGRFEWAAADVVLEAGAYSGDPKASETSLRLL
ncbi:beta-glucosidase family protein [Arthrobacter bambusae]|uniref:beta-glucosidase family protein n=1 Tax=Arthrobacter bambusae TaxID=1338426 RepID=UPI002784CE4D|nr:glycoside hydrolase family 3 C-terminal domain-containing protein [Arthrobacter bambusae]MDQ0031495.1 beta-glucosidase-like glycosyl hydrolase [Arthrobacter bambusae]MDQ0099718.1 beta-glucosidase-like glycosyl hydrolase [Arthrobacter bambusae]